MMSKSMRSPYDSRENDLGIVSIIYQESGWEQTRQLVNELGLPTIYVDRGGAGSLAEALNRGFGQLTRLCDTKYVWFLTDVVFNPDIVPKLLEVMNVYGLNAISPAFEGDHPFCKPNGTNRISLVDFIEFVALMARVDTFKEFQLDENMPYWGHDFDWGYRVRDSGGLLGIHNGVTLNHTYLRYIKPEPITHQRIKIRRQFDQSTSESLRAKYGDNWHTYNGYKWAYSK